MSDIYKQKTIYMKNLFNNMDSFERDRILEMHKNQGYSLSEQESIQQQLARKRSNQSDVEKAAAEAKLKAAAEASTNSTDLDNQGFKRGAVSGADDDSRQGTSYKEMDIPQTIEIGSSLFKNGVANIDRNNAKYKEAIAELKKLPIDASVDIVGGASAVGSKTFGKEQNQKLAMLRATNFINAAKSDGVKITMTPSGKVGTNTEKNSPGAEAEQFVKIEFFKEGGGFGRTAIKTTRVDTKRGGSAIEPIPGGGGEKLYKMCIDDITASQYVALKDLFTNPKSFRRNDLPVGSEKKITLTKK